MTEYAPEFSAAQTLWYVALSLQAESNHEIPEHLDHDCYAGMLVMQDLILALYPEVAGIPVQRQPERDRDYEDYGGSYL